MYDALALRDAAIAAKADSSDLSSKVDSSTSVLTGAGLTGGGDLSTDRTISLTDTTVTPGSYTNATVTVDAQGRITASSSGTTVTTALPKFFIVGLEMAKIDTSTISVSDGMARSINNDTDIELTGSGGLTNLDFTSDTGFNSVKLYP